MVSNDTIKNAPACFGSISCFSQDSECCQKCVAFEACAERSIETLHAIKSVVNVDDLLKKHRMAKMQKQYKIDATRQDMNKAREATYAPPQPTKPQIAERATKVEAVVLDVSAEDEAMVQKLPVKAQPVALTWLKSGIVYEIRQGMNESRNAMKGKKPAWLDVLIQGLIDGGFTKAELKQRFIDEFAWTDGTAASHVSLGLALLLCFRVLKQDSSGRIVACQI